MHESPITVIIASWGRPLYLWNCLDTLSRRTTSPARFVLINNHHPDPGVEEVIRAFERRGFFAAVRRFVNNSVENLLSAYADEIQSCGPEHVFLESDTVVSCSVGCWLAEMRRIFRAHPSIGMLGSLVDTTDFVSPEAAGKLAASAGDAEFLAKLTSPERGFHPADHWHDGTRDFFPTRGSCPIENPPGRLLMLETSHMRRVGLLPDSALAESFRQHGFLPAVTARVRHRHLSLLNIYDYPTYDRTNRNTFFDTMLASRGTCSESAR